MIDVKRKKTLTRLGVGAIGVVLMLSGCAANSGGSGGDAGSGGSALTGKVDYSGTITMINKYADPSTSKFFPAMAKAYEKLHPKVKVTIQQESDQGYKDKIKVLASSHSIPDIYFAWAGSYSKNYVNAGFAMDLSSVIGPKTAWGKTLAPSAVAAYNYGGKDYGIPIDLDAKFMLYNKKIFAANGVSVPTSLSGLLSTCKALKAKGVTPMLFGNVDGWPALHYVTQLNAYDVPAATLNSDYNSAHGKFTDPGYVQALTQFKQIITQCTNTGNSSNGVNHTDAQVAFDQGKAAMMYQEWVEFGLTQGTPIAKQGWGFFQLPAAAGSKGSTTTLEGAPDGFLINSKAKNPALDIDFMKFVVSKKNASLQQKLMVGYPSPVLGSMTPANSSPQSVQALADVNKASNLAIWLDTVTPTQVASAYLSGGEGLVSGSLTPQAVMQSVQKAAAGQ